MNVPGLYICFVEDKQGKSTENNNERNTAVMLQSRVTPHIHRKLNAARGAAGARNPNIS